ncbi:MAG: hypothetical protein WAJ93_17065, partial [Candidatus Nitrosopolaris sp.]
NTNETFSGNANTLVLLQMQRTLIVLLRAFHSAVHEKADMERIPLDAAAYRIAEDIRYYLQLGGLKQEQNKISQQGRLGQINNK